MISQAPVLCLIYYTFGQRSHPHVSETPGRNDLLSGAFADDSDPPSVANLGSQDGRPIPCRVVVRPHQGSRLESVRFNVVS